jgi:transposase-like protein
MLEVRTNSTPSLSGEREKHLSLVEPVETVAVGGVPNRPDARRRPRLSKDEEREIARLYAENIMTTSQIREQFGIGDGSLYRAVQRQGVALRGRTAPRTPTKAPQAQAPATRRRRSPSTSRVRVDGTAAQYQFRVQFVAERTIEATDMRDALRQAESFGATEITALSRAD